MTFNQLKEYHLKNISVILNSGKEVVGVITSHHWDSDNNEVIAISILNRAGIERVNCMEIHEIRVHGDAA